MIIFSISQIIKIFIKCANLSNTTCPFVFWFWSNKIDHIYQRQTRGASTSVNRLYIFYFRIIWKQLKSINNNMWRIPSYCIYNRLFSKTIVDAMTQLYHPHYRHTWNQFLNANTSAFILYTFMGMPSMVFTYDLCLSPRVR